MNIIGYKWTCKQCGHIAKEQQNSAVFEDMDSVCQCGGSMKSEPIFETSDKAFDYELWINNKTTGVTVRGSVSLTLDETNNVNVKKNMIKKISNEFARMMTTEENQKQLVMR